MNGPWGGSWEGRSPGSWRARCGLWTVFYPPLAYAYATKKFYLAYGWSLGPSNPGTVGSPGCGMCSLSCHPRHRVGIGWYGSWTCFPAAPTAAGPSCCWCQSPPQDLATLPRHFSPSALHPLLGAHRAGGWGLRGDWPGPLRTGCPHLSRWDGAAGVWGAASRSGMWG